MMDGLWGKNVHHRTRQLTQHLNTIAVLRAILDHQVLLVLRVHVVLRVGVVTVLELKVKEEIQDIQVRKGLKEKEAHREV